MDNQRIRELQKIKKKLNMTYDDIAQSSGLPLSTVQKVLGGKVPSPRLDTLTALEKVLLKSSSTNSRAQSEISTGNQDFSEIISNNYFYVDKSSFIKKWWESADVVTLITRPRRFGKTLNLSMLDHFFSNKYDNGETLFNNLSIWNDENYHKLVNTYPVLFISFASVKGTSYETSRSQIIQEIVSLYRNNAFLAESGILTEKDLAFWNEVTYEMDDAFATNAIKFLCEMLNRYYNKKVLIFLDEYDTPMQEAYIDGFWDEMASFIRSIFNASFKTNPYLERALMTGITRVSKESIFSDLNNLKVDTMANAKYDTDFGFTEDEIVKELTHFGLETTFSDVKKWYDGFRIGDATEIYNPWSFTQYLDTKTLNAYWANTSENMLAEKLIREGSADVKKSFESLLRGESVEVLIDDEITYKLIDKSESGIYSLLLAAGYLKIDNIINNVGIRKKVSISLTNFEVVQAFEDMIRRWFEDNSTRYNDFIKALLMNDVKYMNRFMNDVALSTFSVFDVGKHASAKHEPERFYHGFVLGLMVDLTDKYNITSNRESGFGRYDVCLEPKDISDPAYVLEFKVHDPDDEKSLEDTVRSALSQIEEKNYDAVLIKKGIKKKNIHHYGFAFEGKKVLIG